jgi:Ser/Thr protein kinase RdoA (MazF antagonist)
MIEATPEVLRDVLECWGVEPAHVTLLRSSGNIHRRIATRAEDFVVRRYRAGQTADSIEYELHVLRHLQQWPVAASLAQVLWREDTAFALFPLLAGKSSA